MRSAAILCLGLLPLQGCGTAPPPIPEGCYRFGDGQPLFKVVGNRGIFVSGQGLRSFAIGAEGGARYPTAARSVEVTPGFYLHDGTATPPAGRARMPVAESSKPGWLGFEQRDGRYRILVPVEAYGEMEVVRGSAC